VEYVCNNRIKCDWYVYIRSTARHAIQLQFNISANDLLSALMRLYIPHIFYSEGVADRYSFEIPTFYQNDLAVRDTADVTGSKPIAV
jgi:hypothetical protein